MSGFRLLWYGSTPDHRRHGRLAIVKVRPVELGLQHGHVEVAGATRPHGALRDGQRDGAPRDRDPRSGFGDRGPVHALSLGAIFHH